MYIGLRVKCPLFVSNVLMKLEFSRQISENTQIQIFMKIRAVGAELFDPDGRMGGQRDMTKLIVGFGNLANALNKCNKNNDINAHVERYVHGMDGWRTALQMLLGCVCCSRRNMWASHSNVQRRRCRAVWGRTALAHAS